MKRKPGHATLRQRQSGWAPARRTGEDARELAANVREVELALGGAEVGLEGRELLAQR